MTDLSPNPKSRRVRFAIQNNDGSAISNNVWVFSTRAPPSIPKQYSILKNQPSRKSLLLKMILGDLGGCFQKKGCCFHLLDEQNCAIVKSFNNLNEILRFMLQHGIPQADRLSEAMREELTRSIVFCQVPHQDFVNAQLGRDGFMASDARILSSDDEIVSLLHKVGFVFVDSKGNKLHKPTKAAQQQQQPSKFARILAPGSSRNGGSAIMSFTTLDEVRVFVRHERLMSSNKVLSNHLEQRLQMLALRVWGATALVPLPTFDWDRFRAQPNCKPTPMELLKAAHFPKMSAMPPILKKQHLLRYTGSNNCSSSIPSTATTHALGGNVNHVRTVLGNHFQQQQQHEDSSQDNNNPIGNALKNKSETKIPTNNLVHDWQHLNQSSVNDENIEN